MRITSLIAAAAAALLVTAGTAAAETVTSGRLDIHYQDISSDSADATVVGVTGAIAAPITDTVALQLDGTVDNVDTDGSDDINVASGTAHLFRRDENKLYGALAGVIHSDDSTTWGAGVEADFYGENGTVGGRVLYLNNDDADVDFIGVDAHYRHFVNDNLRLELSAGYGQADSNGDDADIMGVGAEAEYQFAAAPISLFAGVSWANVDSDFGDEDVTVATVGIRWNFGQDTLKGRDRSGASLKGINDLFGASSIVGAASSYTPPIEEEPVYQYAS